MDPVSATGLEHDTLRLWEQAVGLDRWSRDEALLRSQGRTSTVLGARNAALLALRSHLFGSAWLLRSNCPGCKRLIEFSVDSARLARECAPSDLASCEHELQVEGHVLRFRLPRVEDLRGLKPGVSGDVITAELFRHCVVVQARPDDADHAELPASVSAALSQHMEALDPGASLSFALTCPDCGCCWQAPLDAGEALWAELQASVERTLLEVDALARAYGWNETEILALSPMRRAAYLQLAGAT